MVTSASNGLSGSTSNNGDLSVPVFQSTTVPFRNGDSRHSLLHFNSPSTEYDTAIGGAASVPLEYDEDLIDDFLDEVLASGEVNLGTRYSYDEWEELFLSHVE